MKIETYQQIFEVTTENGPLEQKTEKPINKQRSVQTYMAALETAVEWLRPLVKTKAWDYSIIWKLGDDPSRFIKWGACCCSGANGGHFKMKEETGLEKHLIIECKDTRNKHPVRTKACRALAQFPSSIGLYSGIHGEVVISKQPKWLTLANASISNSLSEPVGTQVLIPVAGGLIELFSKSLVPKNQEIIDFIFSRFTSSAEQEIMSEKSYINFNHQIDWPPSLHYLNLNPEISQLNIDSSFEGSSIISTLSNEHQSFNIHDDHVFGKMLPEKSSGKYSEIPSSNLNLKRKQNADENTNLKDLQRGGKEHYQSKNLITERNRRKRIKDGLFALRSLVPLISKMDRASILGDAIRYIKELQETIEKYQDELREMAEDCNRNNAKTELRSSIEERAGREYLLAADIDKGYCSASEKKQAQVEVEVSQIGARVFLLRCIFLKKRGGFVRLMEAMDSLGLKVMDANVTTLNGSVLNVFTVEANRSEIESKSLKQYLIQLVNN
ncbi:transcription factor bHLH90 [Olea europaea subsp. europaea]|uniref:Transcription factor bHLH90 n=2 Tax=Olea europaea subsp. europaea TaxID=158383 RepID=A0A8S0PS76_OLEEU|nr:transcription factor bHLH90 [Olea europaea subsp. europaea]